MNPVRRLLDAVRERWNAIDSVPLNLQERPQPRERLRDPWVTRRAEAVDPTSGNPSAIPRARRMHGATGAGGDDEGPRLFGSYRRLFCLRVSRVHHSGSYREING
jgi:hypothetical protein